MIEEYLSRGEQALLISILTEREPEDAFKSLEDIKEKTLYMREYRRKKRLGLLTREKQRLITYKGETHNIKEWSEITGINHNTLLYRLNSPNFTIEEVFERKIGVSRRRKTK